MPQTNFTPYLFHTHLIRLLKTHTPDYHVNIAWRSEKLQKYFSHKLKLPVSDTAEIGTTYVVGPTSIIAFVKKNT